METFGCEALQLDAERRSTERGEKAEEENWMMFVGWKIHVPATGTNRKTIRTSTTREKK
ncbi:uncharacterized protein V6R79_013078 [Siganus canaliculatus]